MYDIYRVAHSRHHRERIPSCVRGKWGASDTPSDSSRLTYTMSKNGTTPSLPSQALWKGSRESVKVFFNDSGGGPHSAKEGGEENPIAEIGTTNWRGIQQLPQATIKPPPGEFVPRGTSGARPKPPPPPAWNKTQLKNCCR